MLNEDFQKVLDELIAEVQRKNKDKGLEYSRNKDRFHNFIEGAKEFDMSKEKYLWVLASKHRVSLKDMIDDLDRGVSWSLDVWKEKITDMMLYLSLLHAMRVEEQEDENKS